MCETTRGYIRIYSSQVQERKQKIEQKVYPDDEHGFVQKHGKNTQEIALDCGIQHLNVQKYDETRSFLGARENLRAILANLQAPFFFESLGPTTSLL